MERLCGSERFQEMDESVHGLISRTFTGIRKFHLRDWERSADSYGIYNVEEQGRGQELYK